KRDWSSDVCSSDLSLAALIGEDLFDDVNRCGRVPLVQPAQKPLQSLLGAVNVPPQIVTPRLGQCSMQRLGLARRASPEGGAGFASAENARRERERLGGERHVGSQHSPSGGTPGHPLRETPCPPQRERRDI